MLFFSFFKTLVDQQVKIELKNDIEITGTLKSIDQYLNLKLDNIKIIDNSNNSSTSSGEPGTEGIDEISNISKYPHLFAVRSLFIRGSYVRYIHMSPALVDTNLLQDASRREAMALQGDKLAGR